MGLIERSPIALVAECRHEGCEFCGGIARVECIEQDHENMVEYVRRSQLQGAVDLLRELYEAGLDLADLIGSDDAYRRWELAMDAARPAIRGR